MVAPVRENNAGAFGHDFFERMQVAQDRIEFRVASARCLNQTSFDKAKGSDESVRHSVRDHSCVTRAEYLGRGFSH
jgi:hypothetical protein